MNPLTPLEARRPKVPVALPLAGRLLTGLTFFQKESTVAGVFFLIAFLLSANAPDARAAQTPSGAREKTQWTQVQKTKTKRVDTKSSARFRSPQSTIVVKFRKEKMNVRGKNGLTIARNFAEKHRLTVKDVLKDANTIVVTVQNNAKIADVIRVLKADANVLYAEPTTVRSFNQKILKKTLKK